MADVERGHEMADVNGIERPTEDANARVYVPTNFATTLLNSSISGSCTTM